MRILMGLTCMCIMTVALCGCDDDKQATTPPATPVAQPIAAEPLEPVEEAVPVAKPVPAAPVTDPDAVVATVNGTPIKNAAVTAELNKRLEAMKMRMQPGQEMPAAQIQQMRIGVVDMLAQQEVLHQKLAAKDITVSDEDIMARIGEIAAANDQSMDQVKEEIAEYGMTMDDLKMQIRPQVEMQKLAEASLDDPEVIKQAQAFYDENPAYFQTPEQVRASHVLIQIDPEATDEEKAAAKAEAEEVLAKAKAGEDFAALAKEYSDDPGSKDKGGEYTFERGKMVKPFEDTAFGMEPGQVSDLVETQFGYHIIKLSEKMDAKTTPFEEAKEQIVTYLTQKDMQENATIEYSKEEQALREQAQQQQMMQQQMMQQMMQQQMQQQQEAGND